MWGLAELGVGECRRNRALGADARSAQRARVLYTSVLTKGGRKLSKVHQYCTGGVVHHRQDYSSHSSSCARDTVVSGMIKLDLEANAVIATPGQELSELQANDSTEDIVREQWRPLGQRLKG